MQAEVTGWKKENDVTSQRAEEEIYEIIWQMKQWSEWREVLGVGWLSQMARELWIQQPEEK